MFRAGERVGVAVSGGPDSVALLRVLYELRSELGILLGVVHLDHKLRGAESDADAEFTASLARSLGLDFVLESADARAQAAAVGENLEQAARRLRYDFFHRLLRENRFHKIATGHTRADQAETVLFRLLRGATTAGLAGIYPVLDNAIVRPLLEVERFEVLEYLRAAGQSWCEDSTNRSLDLSRNRLRHELLPQLERDWNPAIIATLAQLAEWARDEESYWRAEIERIAPSYLGPPENSGKKAGQGAGRSPGGPPHQHAWQQVDAVYLEASRLAALGPAVERRLLRHAIELVRGDLRGIEFDHIEQIRALAATSEGHGRVQVPGVDVFRSFDQVRLARLEAQQDRDFSVQLLIPGTYDVPQTRTRFVFKLIHLPAGNREYNRERTHLDWERTPQPLWLRNWRPGDRFRPVGRGNPEKLKALFQERKVPLWERRHWPVVASADGVIWTRVFGVAAEFAARPESSTILEIEEQAP